MENASLVDFLDECSDMRMGYVKWNATQVVWKLNILEL